MISGNQSSNENARRGLHHGGRLLFQSENYFSSGIRIP
jgi:hypothetical protein